MDRLICFGLCICMASLGMALTADGQTGAGAGPPSPQIAQPPEQQAAANGNSGLTGPAAVPNPRAGAQLPPADRNNAPGTSPNAATSPGAALGSDAQVQPLYQGSAAIGPAPPTGQNAPLDASAAPTNGTNSATRERGRIGVWLIDSEGPGVRIGRITSGSAAERAGLEPGDFLLQVNGRGTPSANDAVQMIRGIPIGQTATLTVWRDGRQQEVQVTMESAREPVEVGYRGSSREGDDAGVTSRVSRLEQQLTMVTEQLQQLQQELSQLRNASSQQDRAIAGRPQAPTAAGGAGAGASVEAGVGNPPSATPMAPSGNPPQNNNAPSGANTSDDLFGPSSPSSN